MRTKKLLAAFLLGVGLCFVPALGHGEVKHWMHETEASFMEVSLLRARVNYIMCNPTSFLFIRFLYDPSGDVKIRYIPEGVDTKGKIIIKIQDFREVFSSKLGRPLLNQFKNELEWIYSYIDGLTTDMDTDIVAIFLDKEGIPLGYFYQGEYHLWEK